MGWNIILSFATVNRPIATAADLSDHVLWRITYAERSFVVPRLDDPTVINLFRELERCKTPESFSVEVVGIGGFDFRNKEKAQDVLEDIGRPNSYLISEINFGFPTSISTISAVAVQNLRQQQLTNLSFDTKGMNLGLARPIHHGSANSAV